MKVKVGLGLCLCLKVDLTSKLELHSAVVVSRFLQSQVPAIDNQYVYDLCMI